MKKSFLLSAALCLGLAATSLSAPAQQKFPTHPVTIVVPYPAGGSVDFTARILAQSLSQTWKQPVIVNNRSGAAAVIGSQFVARSKPDGYTILLATAGMSIQPSVYKNLPYDVFKDFAPVTLIVNSPSLLSAHPSIPGNSLKELIAYLKAHPGTPYGSQGVASYSNLLMEIFRANAGLNLVNIPYRGSAPETQALLRGETKLQFDIAMTMMPNIESGKAKAIAVTTPQRLKQLPNVPTMRELGFPEIVSSWSGFFVPAGTPPEVINEIQRATKLAIADPTVSRQLLNSGFEIVGSTPDELRTTFRDDVNLFKKAADSAHIDKTDAN